MGVNILFESQEIIFLKQNTTEFVPDHSLTLNYKKGNLDWYVSAGRPGYQNDSATLNINEAFTCFFGDLFEVRLLDVDYDSARILLTKLPVLKEAESIFNQSQFFKGNNTDFTEKEVVILRKQMDLMRDRIEDLVQLTEIQKEYLEKSFEMLKEKLDQGSKEGWRQAAYGVVTSVACTFAPDITSARNLFEIFGTYITSASNFLLTNS
ncbi:hypothetical protein [Aeromonas veronii]|uniref:hypothetical protein n=1 Tax=Aeromonas veronii TaxID=654 RepID=UPI000F5E7884|nr:hypothetical protein [Aeromonas veronii]